MAVTGVFALWIGIRNGHFVLKCHLNDKEQLWISDGTAAGTLRIATFSSIGNMIAIGDTLYFAASTTSDQSQLWKQRQACRYGESKRHQSR